MRTKRSLIRVGTLVAFGLLVGCQLPALELQGAKAPPASGPPVAGSIEGQWIVQFKGGRVPSNFAASVKAAGGTLMKALDPIGVALVKSSEPGYAERLGQHPDVEGVLQNALVTISELPGAAAGRVSPRAQAAGATALTKKPGDASPDARRGRGHGNEGNENLECDFNPKGHPFDPTFRQSRSATRST